MCGGALEPFLTFRELETKGVGLQGSEKPQASLKDSVSSLLMALDCRGGAPWNKAQSRCLHGDALESIGVGTRSCVGKRQWTVNEAAPSTGRGGETRGREDAPSCRSPGQLSLSHKGLPRSFFSQQQPQVIPPRCVLQKLGGFLDEVFAR